MSDINISLKALEAAAKAAYEADWYDTNEKWENALPDVKDVYHTIAYAACQGMLKSWPGMVDHPSTAISPRCLWLPLPTENNNVEV